LSKQERELSERVQRVCRERIEELGRALEHVDA
jgi:hypothetical protein